MALKGSAAVPSVGNSFVNMLRRCGVETGATGSEGLRWCARVEAAQGEAGFLPVGPEGFCLRSSCLWCFAWVVAWDCPPPIWG
eukprot:364785-Chlamydomonas_euryale.AAC.3